ncbi:unnamed protein product [Orchesella dallaii]|uniref:Uncharacterized protein n=1 Tax=Orchesella dallaii TaxID=48710 RepID=A0ABP1PRV1_9HEXA
MCSLSFILAFSILSLYSFADGVLHDLDYVGEDARLSVSVKVHPELCGNGKKDPGEECDCGPPEKCRHDLCCHSTCQLKLHSQCSNNEPCCEKCKFKSLGAVCKVAKHSCDITQYCSGEAGACPTGTFKRNGVNCTEPFSGVNGVCFDGTCKGFHQPCQEGWKTLETEPIKEKTKCLGISICVNHTCVKVRELPNAKPCPYDSQGKECSGSGECTNLHYCRCKPGWTGSDCSVKQDVQSLHKSDDRPGRVKGLGPEQQDSVSNTPALVAGLVTFVIAVSIIFVVMAFRMIPSRTPKENNTPIYPHAQLETVDSDGPNAPNQQQPTT